MSKPSVKKKEKNLSVPALVLLSLAAVSLIASAALFIRATASTLSVPEIFYLKSVSEEFVLIDNADPEVFEGKDEVALRYMSLNYSDCYCTVTHTAESWAQSGSRNITGSVYSDLPANDESGKTPVYLGFAEQPTDARIVSEMRGINAGRNAGLFKAAAAFFIPSLALFAAGFVAGRRRTRHGA